MMMIIIKEIFSTLTIFSISSITTNPLSDRELFTSYLRSTPTKITTVSYTVRKTLIKLKMGVVVQIFPLKFFFLS